MTDTKIPAILAALRAMPWAMHPVKFDAMLELLELRARGIKFTADEIAGRIGDREAATKSSTSRTGTVAVLPLYGVIAEHARNVNQVSTPAGTSTEAFAADFDAALTDPAVRAILIDVDSPGGSVTGVAELSKRIRDARGKKPIVAIANSFAASAAYWIASAADEVWVTPTGEVGSIGVFAVHTDKSEMYADMGIKHTVIKAGKYKAEGNPFEPLSDDALAYAQSQVDEYYGMFIRDVAANRGVSIATVESDFGQGRTATAGAAKRRGMVDKVGTMEDLLGRFGMTRKAGTLPTRSAEEAPLDLAAVAEIRITAGAAAVSDLDDLSINAGIITEFHAPAGAEASETSTSPDQRPHEAKEHTVPDTTAAPSTGAVSTDSTALLAAERQRANDIFALCNEHGVNDANVAQSMISRGISPAEAGLEILRLKRTQQAATASVITAVTDRAADRPFTNLGEQLAAIVGASRPGAQMDPRLTRIAAASGMSEGVPSDGGFQLQPDFSTEILRRSYEVGQILSRCRKVPIGANANGLKINAIDETSRATGSRFGGVQTYWSNEADTATASKPKMRQMILELRKLMAIWYATEEMLQDATALQAVAFEAFAQEITFTVEDTIFNGNGSGQPLGILNSGPLVTVNKESGQAAATFNAQNVAKMYARLWSGSRAGAVWFVNQDVEPQLATMTLGGTTAVPIYLPPGGFSQQPYGTLFGKPVVPVEYCATLGTVGDVILADMGEYLVIDKGGPQQTVSIHVRFLYDEQTFKLTYRVDGQPIWNKALTPKNGSNTLSPFIVLQAR